MDTLNFSTQDGIAWTAIANFISTVDIREGYYTTLKNAARDCWLYGWNDGTEAMLYQAIDELYDAYFPRRIK